jgi:hypothetical protein
MVVSVVDSWVLGRADVSGDPGAGGFGTVGIPSVGMPGTVLGGVDGGFYGSGPIDVLPDDGDLGGFFDLVRDAIGATSGELPTDVADLIERLDRDGTLIDGDLGPPDDGGGFFGDLRDVLGGAGGGFGSVLGDVGPDAPTVGGWLGDVVDAPTDLPPRIEDSWGGDMSPEVGVSDGDGDLGSLFDEFDNPGFNPDAGLPDLDLVVGTGPDPSDDGDGGSLDLDLDLDLDSVPAPMPSGDDPGGSGFGIDDNRIDDLGIDDLGSGFGIDDNRIDDNRIDDLGMDDFGGADLGSVASDDFGMDDLGGAVADPLTGLAPDDLGGMDLPDIEMPQSTEFDHDIQAADSVESSLDDLFGDL